tara:strand:- start:2359 stop:2589 length:231 start_codon:yes stop_codon:yes gene_type:complete
MSGKGDRDRTTNRIAYEESYNRIFRGGKLDSTKVGVTVSPVTESPPSDVGANPTSSTIEKKPFKRDPIKHDITRII